MFRPSQSQTGPPVRCRWPLCLVGLGVWLWFVGTCQHPTVEAVSGIYVNNQRLEKETDRWQLLRPTVAPYEVSKGELLTKANFSESGPTASWVNLFWDRNANHSATGSAATVQYADEGSTIKNTLHDATPTYVADDFRPAILRPSSKPSATTLSTATPGTTPGFPSTTAASPATTVKRKYKHKHHKVRKTTRTTRKPPSPASVVANKRRTELTPEQMTLLQRYYSFSCTLVPKQPPVNHTTTRKATRIRDLTTRSPMTTMTTPSAPPKPTKPRRPKPAAATVYVDPPVIKRLGGMLESVYNFMESALTSTEIDRASNPSLALGAMATRKVKRNTGGALTPTTTTTTAPSAESRTDSEESGWKRFTGADRVTIAGLPAILSTGTDGNKNKMTTNIQVTSEYTAATPATVPLKKPNRVDDDDDDEDDESDSESDADSADYYDGGFDDDDDDDDEDDEDDGGGEDEAIQPPNRRRPNDKDYGDFGTTDTGDRRPFRKHHRRRRKPPTASYDSSEDGSSYEDDDDDEEDDVEYSAKDDRSSSEEEEEDEPPGGFFSSMFATFSRFVRTLGFGGTFRGGDYDEDRGRSTTTTTPRVLAARRRPTRSTTDQYGSTPAPSATVPNRGTAGWLVPYVAPLPSYLFNDLDDTGVAEENDELPTTVEPAGTASWFDLMMPSWNVFNPWGSEEPATEEPSEASSWGLGLGQWFGGDSGTTSTQGPKTTTSGPAVPEQLLSALTQYVAQAQAQVATTTSTTTTRPLRKRRSYAGYQLWRVMVQSTEQLHSLTDYRRSPAGLELQWWIGPSVRGPTDVLVPSTGSGSAQSHFRDYLRDEGIGFETTIGDVGRAIAYENPRMSRRDQIETELLHGHPMTWYRYHRYADIVKFLGSLHRRHAHRVQLLHIGRSYEGRPLTVVRVSFAQPEPRGARRSGRRRPSRRPAIFIEAGVQGRDWIGPAVATWLLNRLVELPPGAGAGPGPEVNGTQDGQDGQDGQSVQSYDWYVLPVLNPDGYEYSHEHDRMWAKSRGNASDDDPEQGGILASALSSWWPMGASDDGPQRRCLGVNLDRNWGHRWGQGAGASRSKCSEDYAGPAPFSEPETRALRDFLLGAGRSRRNLRLYLSLRSYGQALAYPTEIRDEVHEQDDETERDEDVHEMASVGLDALRGSASGSDREQYRLVAGISSAGGAASGTAVEYARYGAGIRYAYVLRLPDTGTHGFLLPPSNIVSTGRDLFELIKGMIEYN